MAQLGAAEVAFCQGSSTYLDSFQVCVQHPDATRHGQFQGPRIGLGLHHGDEPCAPAMKDWVGWHLLKSLDESSAKRSCERAPSPREPGGRHRASLMTWESRSGKGEPRKGSRPRAGAPRGGGGAGSMNDRRAGRPPIEMMVSKAN